MSYSADVAAEITTTMAEITGKSYFEAMNMGLPFFTLFGVFIVVSVIVLIWDITE